MLTAQQITEWAQTCGSSFYLLDLDIVLANYRNLLRAGQAIYEPFGIAYSVKTNYTPAICKALSQEGALLEVVSEMEYDLAIKTGHDPKNLVVNGPVHSTEFIEQVLTEGAIINFDSWYQLTALEEIAGKHPTHLYKFGIRLMPDLGKCVTSRFGFPSDKETLTKLTQRLKKISNAKLISLHCHFCEGARDIVSYGERARQMIEIREKHFQEFQIGIFNLGGGFYSKMPDELKAQFSDPIPELEVYADALCQPFASKFTSGSKPQLLTEPGNAIVADAMQFYCQVLEVKQAGDRQVAFLDGSIYDIKPTKNRKNLPLQILPLSGISQQVTNCSLTGFTCMEDDILYTGYTGQLAPGDYAVFGNTGAYTNVLRPPFIRPSAAIVAKQDGNLFLAKKPGSLASVLQDYCL